MINILTKDTFRNHIERTSDGINTVIYDNKGYPNIMYVLEPPMGGHPAFETADGNVNRVFISKYPTANTEDDQDTPIGIAGVNPTFHSLDDDIFKQDSTNLAAIRSNVETKKGEGWHFTNVLEWNAYLQKTLETNPYRMEFFDVNHIQMSSPSILDRGDKNYFLISSNEFATPETLTPSTVYCLAPDGSTQPIKLTYITLLNDSTSVDNLDSYVKATYVFQYSDLNYNELQKYIQTSGVDAFKTLYVEGESLAGPTFSGTITEKNTGFVSYKTGSLNNSLDGLYGLSDIYYEQFYPGYGEWLDGAYLYKDNEDSNPYVLKIGIINNNYKTVSQLSMGHTSGYNENIRLGGIDNVWKLGLVSSFDSTGGSRISPCDWMSLEWLDTPSDSGILFRISSLFHTNILTNETLLNKITRINVRDDVKFNNSHSIINDYDVEGPPVGFYHYPIRINRFNYNWIKGKNADGEYGGISYNDPRNRFLGFTTRLSYIE